MRREHREPGRGPARFCEAQGRRRLGDYNGVRGPRQRENHGNGRHSGACSRTPPQRSSMPCCSGRSTVSRVSALTKRWAHLQRLSASGVDWWSYGEEYFRSIGPFRDAVLGVLACFARQERIRISERVHAGLRRARREGRQLGRPRIGARRQDRTLTQPRRQHPYDRQRTGAERQRGRTSVRSA